MARRVTTDVVRAGEADRIRSTLSPGGRGGDRGGGSLGPGWYQPDEVKAPGRGAFETPACYSLEPMDEAARPWCNICGDAESFLFPERGREGLVCRNCAASARQRALIYALGAVLSED